jgi:hypothetical protein
VQPAPGGPSESPHTLFWTAVGNSFGRCAAKIQAKIDGVSSHYTSSSAAEPFHILYMDPMSDVSMSNQLLWWPICVAPCCVVVAVVNGNSLAGVQQKSKPKLMVLPATTPHQMLLNHFMSSRCI